MSLTRSLELFLAGFFWLVALGAVLFVLLDVPVYFDCPFSRIFDIRCPVCGGTRAFAELFSGKLLSAFSYNGFVLISFLAGSYYGLKINYMVYKKTPLAELFVHKMVIYGILLIMGLQFIINNTN